MLLDVTIEGNLRFFTETSFDIVLFFQSFMTSRVKKKVKMRPSLRTFYVYGGETSYFELFRLDSVSKFIRNSSVIHEKSCFQCFTRMFETEWVFLFQLFWRPLRLLILNVLRDCLRLEEKSYLDIIRETSECSHFNFFGDRWDFSFQVNFIIGFTRPLRLLIWRKFCSWIYETVETSHFKKILFLDLWDRWDFSFEGKKIVFVMRPVSVLIPWDRWVFSFRETGECSHSMRPLSVLIPWDRWVFSFH